MQHLTRPSSCLDWSEKADAYVTVTFSLILSVALSRSLYASCGHVTPPSAHQRPTVPSFLSSHTHIAFPFSSNHPVSTIDFGAAWSLHLELYTLPQQEPGLLLSSSSCPAAARHQLTILGPLLNEPGQREQVSIWCLASVPRSISCRDASSSA